MIFQDLPHFKGIYAPEIGVNVHGIFIEAAYWNSSQGGLCDAKEGELYSKLPAIRFIPSLTIERGNRYEAPLYKTQDRSGTLSTTGHSTNFILAILLESNLSPDFWILRGTALVSGVTENES